MLNTYNEVKIDFAQKGLEHKATKNSTKEDVAQNIVENLVVYYDIVAQNVHIKLK